jgi:hypothetical protein
MPPVAFENAERKTASAAAAAAAAAAYFLRNAESSLIAEGLRRGHQI